MQKEYQPEFDWLYSLKGFQDCDWLLAPAEREAWQIMDRPLGGSPVRIAWETDQSRAKQEKKLTDVEKRAGTTLSWVIPENWLIDIALDHLTLARVGLLWAILTHPLPQTTLDLPHVAAAVNGLRRAGLVDYLPRGLLTEAWYHAVRGEVAAARVSLDEVQEIAERGPMPHYLADVHLYRARLFRDRGELAKTAKIIRELGYGHRYDELAYAEETAKHW